MNTVNRAERDRIRALAPDQRRLLELRLEQRSKDSETTPITRRHDRSWAPLAPEQERLWLIGQMVPGANAFNISFCVSLADYTDLAAVRMAVEEIVRRHESLRTTFKWVEDRPIQFVHEPGELPLPIRIQDFSELPEAERRKRLGAAAAELFNAPFDLESGPLIRVGLLKCDSSSHVMLVSIHHIVTDNISIRIFKQELAVLYNAFSRGNPSPLPDLPVQYGDFAAWQREHLKGERLEKLLGYWGSQLEGARLSIELPTDRPRPPVQTLQGERRYFRIPGGLHGKLRAFAEAERVSPFILYLTAFGVLLHRYSGQDNFIVSSPFANRNRKEVRGLIGYLLNLLPIRIDLEGNPPFREMLDRIRRAAFGAYENYELPFVKLLELLNPPVDTSRNPIFQNSFIFLDIEDQSPEPPLPKFFSESDINIKGTRFDLTLVVMMSSDSLEGFFEYSTDLWDESFIDRMIGHLGTLLAAAVKDSGCPLSQLPLLTEVERLQTNRYDGAVAPVQDFTVFPVEAVENTIPELFARQVREQSGRMAIVSRNHCWSYRELDLESERVAWLIQTEASAGRERIALLYSHDAPMVAGLLGVLKAGRAYLPLDPANPLERLRRILFDSGASVIVTENRWVELAEDLADGLAVINVDALSSIGSTVSSPRRPDSLAYLLYTSGSTGEPKGVMQNDRNLLHHVRAYSNSLHLNARDRLTLFSSYTFDAAVLDIFSALLSGATLYPVDVGGEAPRELNAWLDEQGITVFHATPTVYRHILGQQDNAGQLSSVRVVVLGGEPVFRDDVDLYRQHFPADCLFVNLLGSTESTTTLQYWLDRDTALSGYAVPVGYPVADTEVLLLDESGEPTDLLGEIAIRSRYLALGYWHQDSLTREKFTADASDSGLRTYRSGDLGWRRADGGIEFAGRKDQQLKVRGYRIEAGEVEAALCRQERVDRAAVVLHRDAQHGEQLVAYLVFTDGMSVDTEVLKNGLKAIIPAYMIPSWMVELDELPMTAGGKLDRRRLPAPEIAFAASREFAQPTTATERRLVEIWESVLPVERAGIHDNFFDLGGHSLMATRVVSRIQAVMHVKLSLSTLFRQPTIAELATLVDEYVNVSEATDSIEPIERVDAEIDPAYLEELSDKQVEKLLSELDGSVENES